MKKYNFPTLVVVIVSCCFIALSLFFFLPIALPATAFDDSTNTAPNSSSNASPPSGMVLIPAGSFEMGTSFNEGSDTELPVHTVFVSAESVVDGIGHL